MFKTFTLSGTQTVIRLPLFNIHPEICPVTLLQYYINRTEEHLRIYIQITDYWFVIRSHIKRNCNQTFSCWIRSVMKDGGIHVKKFSPPSTRHAYTSTANREGVTLDHIFRTAGCSESSRIFASHYNRPIGNDYTFAKTVLM